VEVLNSVTVVTGGASGLGAGVVEAVVAAGGRSLIADRDSQRSQELVERLGERVRYVQTDVADEASVANAVDAAMSWGPLRYVVNCAGVAWTQRTVGTSGAAHDLQGFERIMRVNLLGTFNVMRLAAAAMATLDPIDSDGERGVIVNTASIAAFDGQAGQVAYAASKGGIVSMTLPAARDLAALGIRVNAPSWDTRRFRDSGPGGPAQPLPQRERAAFGWGPPNPLRLRRPGAGSGTA
jgi:NAD(P)-dependent dehydrogenase (short-subunit alcohol dehydrogenase family)